ncbi:MAG: magnesium transporter MgtE N-terminal domain-containing protein [Clostridium sp.]
MLGAEWVAEIFSYIEDPDEYLQELNLDRGGKSACPYMDSDDAVDVLDELDDSTQEKLVGMLDEESSHRHQDDPVL